MKNTKQESDIQMEQNYNRLRTDTIWVRQRNMAFEHDKGLYI